MNIRETLIQFELGIQAGGPGSGCQGPNCGAKKTREMLDSAGYKRTKGKGFGLMEGDTAHSKGRGQDAHVVVVGEHDVVSFRPYGTRAGQFDE